METLNFTVCLHDLDLAPSEKKLKLSFWSTVVRSFTDGVVVAELDAHELSHEKEIKVSLPVKWKGLTEGDAVWLDMAAFAPSIEGQLVGMPAGSAMCFFGDLKTAAIQNAFPLAMPAVLALPGTGKGLTKATFVVDGFDEATLGRLRDLKLEKEPRLALTSSPIQQLICNALLDSYITAVMYPFTEDALAAGRGFAATSEPVSQLHAPMFVANVPVPTYMYVGEVGKPDLNSKMERYLATAAAMALRRHDWTEEQFLRVTSGQWRDEANDTYDDDFTLACAITVDALMQEPVSLFYRYDEAFSGKKGRMDIEAFSDMSFMEGDDCDGGGSLGVRRAAWLRTGRPELASQKYWEAKGSWKSPVLQQMQHILFWYEASGSLGSVTSAHVGNAKGSEGQSVFIDSKQDLAATTGGHMWADFFPTVVVEHMLMAANSEVKEGDLQPTRRGRYPPWLIKMPVLTGEGTGWCHPMALPFECYAHTAQGRERFKEQQRRVSEAQRYCVKNSNLLSKLSFMRMPEQLSRLPNTRATSFYRHTTSMFLSFDGLPHRHGQVYCTYVDGARRPESDGRLGNMNRRDNSHPPIPGELRYGVNFEDKIVNRNGVALILAPEPTAEEAESFLERAKHLRPWATPTATEDELDSIAARFRPLVQSFCKTLGDKYTPGGKNATGTKVCFVARKLEFTLADIVSHLPRQLRKMDRVNGVDATIEMLDKHVYNVLIEVWVDDDSALSTA